MKSNEKQTGIIMMILIMRTIVFGRQFDLFLTLESQNSSRF